MARLISAATEPVAGSGPSLEGPVASGFVAMKRAPSPIRRMARVMRSALNALDAHSEETAMIGDRMDTDIVAGLEAGLETVLVLTGVTGEGEEERFPYRPSRILGGVGELLAELG